MLFINKYTSICIYLFIYSNRLDYCLAWYIQSLQLACLLCYFCGQLGRGRCLLCCYRLGRADLFWFCSRLDRGDIMFSSWYILERSDLRLLYCWCSLYSWYILCHSDLLFTVITVDVDIIAVGRFQQIGPRTLRILEI